MASGAVGTGIVRENQDRNRRVYSRFALLRASPAGSEEGALFYVFTARLKPCPDTCMIDGCGMAVQTDMGEPTLVRIRKGWPTRLPDT